MNAWGDLGVISDKFSKETITKSKVFVPEDILRAMPDSPREIMTKRTTYPGTAIERLLRCSAMFKLLPGHSDILYGHTTWSSFVILGPRIFKRYSLLVPTGSDDVTGFELRSISFSSSPGTE